MGGRYEQYPQVRQSRACCSLFLVDRRAVQLSSETIAFDYVIVGAGSSGATLASRLSEDASLSVCLIEAGPKDSSPLIKIPLGLIWLAKDRRHNWLYTSTPQQGLGGRQISVPRGKTLGGSSAINGMIYIRGHKDDYDGWAEMGCIGWDYASVLPYFKRSEANANVDLGDDMHGRNGPLSVTSLRSPNAMDHVFMKAAGDLQLRQCPDFNTAEPEGVGIYQVTQKNGQRHSSAAAFLSVASKRSNLQIVTGAQAERIELNDGRAIAVHLSGPTRRIEARGEIILCAGAIGSPDLLLRSGIGPAIALKNAGSEVIHDLPGVGQNLQDHVDSMVICKSRSTTPYGISLRAAPRLVKDGVDWVTRKRGLLSSNMVEAGGFARTTPAERRPDIQFHFIPGRKSHRGRMVEYGHGISLHTCLLRPDSTGSITRSGQAGPPQIDLGLLSAESDVVRLTKGVRMARNILAQAPFKPHALAEITPGSHVQCEDDLTAHVRNNARTVYHPVGTCAMGTGAQSVTDPRLRVHGIRGLRVVDSSIMPRIVSGNTNAPAIMIAEKAADMITEDRMARQP